MLSCYVTLLMDTFLHYLLVSIITFHEPGEICFNKAVKND